MITGIATENFCSQNRYVEIPGNRVIMTGPNGSGKTSQLNAIPFTLTGELPGVKNTAQDIFAAAATGEAMSSTIIGSGDRGDYSARRTLSRTRKGTIKTEGLVNGTKATRTNIGEKIASAGADTRIVDLIAFWQMSDAKMIEFLSGFYPGGNISVEAVNETVDETFRCLPSKSETIIDQIDNIIKEIKEVKSDRTAIIKGAEQSITTLYSQQEEIRSRAGSLADTQAEIKATDKDLKEIRKGLRQEGKSKAEFDAWKGELEREGEAYAVQEGSGLLPASVYFDQLKVSSCKLDKARLENSADAPVWPEILTLIDEIRAAMDKAGCEICPVKMLLKVKRRQASPKPQETIDTTTLEQERDAAESLLQQANNLEQIKTRIDELNADPRSKIILTESAAEQDARIEGLEKKLEVLRESEKELLRAHDLDASIEKIRLDKAEAEVMLDIAKESEKAITELRRTVVTKLFKPVEAAVTKFLPFGLCACGFDSTGKLQIGWNIRGNGSTPRPLLSGGEKARFDPAFALGIISLTNSAQPRVLMIEAAEIDNDNFTLFCAALNQAPENIQIFVATWIPVNTGAADAAGFQVVDMMAPAEEIQQQEAV